MRGQLHALRLETSGFQLPQRRKAPAFFAPCYSVPDHAGPWRRAAAKPQDGCGTAAGPKFSSFNSRFCFYPLCFADSASSRQIHPLPFGLPPFGLKGRHFNGQAKRLLYSGQTWTSYVGILHRMPKPGSFASIVCTLSEHLRARPKGLHLQGGTGGRLPSQW